jgi:hypothetical protein
MNILFEGIAKLTPALEQINTMFRHEDPLTVKIAS